MPNPCPIKVGRLSARRKSEEEGAVAANEEQKRASRPSTKQSNIDLMDWYQGYLKKM
jgi:hypothetical protein